MLHKKYPGGYLRRPSTIASRTILILERLPPSLGHNLSCWPIKVQAHIFVGKVNEEVQEALWETGDAPGRRRVDTAIVEYQIQTGLRGFT